MKNKDIIIEPFQKAKTMALREGKMTEGEKYGKKYILIIKEWGMIVYSPGNETIILGKGPPITMPQLVITGKPTIITFLAR